MFPKFLYQFLLFKIEIVRWSIIYNFTWFQTLCRSPTLHLTSQYFFYEVYRLSFWSHVSTCLTDQSSLPSASLFSYQKRFQSLIARHCALHKLQVFVRPKVTIQMEVCVVHQMDLTNFTQNTFVWKVWGWDLSSCLTGTCCFSNMSLYRCFLNIDNCC